MEMLFTCSLVVVVCPAAAAVTVPRRGVVLTYTQQQVTSKLNATFWLLSFAYCCQ